MKKLLLVTAFAVSLNPVPVQAVSKCKLDSIARLTLKGALVGAAVGGVIGDLERPAQSGTLIGAGVGVSAVLLGAVVTNINWQIRKKLFTIAGFGDRKWLLLDAADHGDVSIVKELLASDTQFSDSAKLGLLQRACIYGHADIVALLLEHHPDVNWKQALHMAAYKGHTEVVKLLLLHGADVNAQDEEGKTACRYAQEEGYIDVVVLLVAHGAESDFKKF